VSTSGAWSGQFGVPIAGGAARRAFATAHASPHLDLCAIHAHRGGMIRSEDELTAFVQEVLQFADSLRIVPGLDISILDFGGSLCTPAVHSPSAADRRMNRTLLRDMPAPDIQDALTIERYLEIVTTMVRDHYAKASRPQPRIFLEPGRSLTSSTQLLLTTVHSLKHADDRTYAILDGGVNIAEPVRGEYHQLLPVNRAGDATTIYTVVGPICTPGDTLYPAVRLPELQVGDALAIMDAGAYFVPFSTSFSFPQPAIIAIENGQSAVIRRAEHFEDLVDRDRLDAHD
jgi:diaminopimelate decarboxylase